MFLLAGALDYAVISSTTINFPAGTTEAFFSVNTLTDSFNEGEESFTATLSSPTGAGLGAATVAMVFIRDRKRVLYSRKFSPRCEFSEL